MTIKLIAFKTLWFPWEYFTALWFPWEFAFHNHKLSQDEEGLMRLNERGELRRLMSALRDKEGVERVCRGCGGCGHTPCHTCGGSRVSTNMWHGSVKLRCTQCDMAGLVRCSLCLPWAQQNVNVTALNWINPLSLKSKHFNDMDKRMNVSICIYFIFPIVLWA